MENKSKHTPGPWKAPGIWDISGLVENNVEHAPKGGERWKADTPVICTLPKDISNRANAYLIAAAPDLLAAAIRALNLLESIGKGTWADTPAGHDLRAAIAKAVPDA